MIDHVRDLVRFLAQDLTVEQIAARVGAVDRDPGVPLPIELRPTGSELRAASLSRYPETGKPFALELELAAPVTVASLQGAFGAYREGRTDRGQPREILFYPAEAGTPWKVVVIAQLPPGASPIADGAASVVILRRDPR